jgi:hypothetical protein
MFTKKSKVIIGGSGPSLNKIDYSRLPENAEIWRINNFFKEQDYFLGKNVDAIFNGGPLEEVIDRYHTFHVLAEQDTYNINFDMIFNDKTELCKDFPDLFKNKYELIKKFDKEKNINLYPVINYNSLFLGKHTFTGVAAVIQAMLSGFDEIYIIGIDNNYEMYTE